MVLTVTAGPTSADGYDWYKVRTDGGMSGWVAATYVASSSSWAQFAIGDFAMVDLSSLNCRSGRREARVLQGLVSHDYGAVAAAAMALSSVSVIANSLRLRTANLDD